MTDDVETARELYRALDARDVPALARLLAEDFEGEVTRGLPGGLGGTYRGPEAMLKMWGRVGRLFDVRPRPDEILTATDGRVVVVGRYLGRGRESGRELDAAFVHVLDVVDGRIRRLLQVTDSQRWNEALG